MKRKESHKDPLANRIKAPFEVPQEYFSHAQAEIMAALDSAAKPTEVRFYQRPAFKALAAILIIAMISLALLIKQNPKADKPLAGNVKQQSNSLSSPASVKQPENRLRPQEDKIVQNQKDEENETELSAREIKKAQSLPAHGIAKRYAPKNAAEKPRDKSGSKATADEQNGVNLPPENPSPALAYQSTVSPTPTAKSSNKSYPVGARKASSAKKQAHLLTIVGDTCSLTPALLTARYPDSLRKNIRLLWSTGQAGNSIVAVSSGVYTVKAFSLKGKKAIDSAQIELLILPEPKPNLGPDQIICAHEVISLKPANTNEHYHYSWTLQECQQAQLTVHDLQAGTYAIGLTIEACGKTFKDEMKLSVKDCKLKISNVITPNGDGFNDYFYIEGLEHYPGSTLIIADRNGKSVYESNNYQNNWDGAGLPDGTYFYVLRLKDKKRTEKTGIVSILRK